VVDAWYQTAQIGNRSLDFIDTALSLGKPFFAYLGPHAVSSVYIRLTFHFGADYSS
jgi:hypothetical protein